MITTHFQQRNINYDEWKYMLDILCLISYFNTSVGVQFNPLILFIDCRISIS